MSPTEVRKELARNEGYAETMDFRGRKPRGPRPIDPPSIPETPGKPIDRVQPLCPECPDPENQVTITTQTVCRTWLFCLSTFRREYKRTKVIHNCVQGQTPVWCGEWQPQPCSDCNPLGDWPPCAGDGEVPCMDRAGRPSEP